MLFRSRSEVNFAVGYNDVDFCLKLREHGYTNLCNPEVVLIHHESISRGKDETPEKRTRFWKEISLLKKRWPDVGRSRCLFRVRKQIRHQI